MVMIKVINKFLVVIIVSVVSTIFLQNDISFVINFYDSFHIFSDITSNFNYFFYYITNKDYYLFFNVNTNIISFDYYYIFININNSIFFNLFNRVITTSSFVNKMTSSLELLRTFA